MKHLIPPHVQAAWRSGNKIHAIKALREVTGLGLAEAKELLEAEASPQGLASLRIGQQLPADVRAALDNDNKIEAIKLLRENTGLGLKEAKDCIDAAESETSSTSESFRHGLSPGEVPRISTRSAVVFVVGVAVAVGLWLHFKAG